MDKFDIVKSFVNQEFGEIRIVIMNDEPWFVAADVCAVFGVANSRNVTAKLDEDEKDVCIVDTLGGRQNVTIVNEAGLYHVLFTMTPKNARNVSKEDIALRTKKLKEFKRWVTHEVLPSIRNSGGYISVSEKFANMYFQGVSAEQKQIVISQLDRIVELQNANLALTKENTSLSFTNKCLVKETRTWSRRKVVVAMIRSN